MTSFHEEATPTSGFLPVGVGHANCSQHRPGRRALRADGNFVAAKFQVAPAYRYLRTCAVGRRRLPLLVLPLVLAGGAVLPACSLKASSTLSAASLENHVPRQPGARLPHPPTAGALPAGVRSQAGARFTCTATLDGQQLPLAGPSPMHVATSSSARPTPSSSPRPLMPRSPTALAKAMTGHRRLCPRCGRCSLQRWGGPLAARPPSPASAAQVVVTVTSLAGGASLQGAPVQAVPSAGRAGPLGSYYTRRLGARGAVGGAPTAAQVGVATC